MNISHSCTCTNVDSTGLNGIHVYFYRLEEPILHLLGGLWTCLLVITSPNQNLCGWNLEHKWQATVHTHTRKMGEITQGVPLKGAKTCFVCFFVINATRPFGHLYCTDFDHFWNNRRESLSACVHRWKISKFLHIGFSTSQNSPKYGTVGRCASARRSAQTAQFPAVNHLGG